LKLGRLVSLCVQLAHRPVKLHSCYTSASRGAGCILETS